jgi:hypothetical protein
MNLKEVGIQDAKSAEMTRSFTHAVGVVAMNMNLLNYVRTALSPQSLGYRR